MNSSCNGFRRRQRRGARRCIHAPQEITVVFSSLPFEFMLAAAALTATSQPHANEWTGQARGDVWSGALGRSEIRQSNARCVSRRVGIPVLGVAISEPEHRLADSQIPASRPWLSGYSRSRKE